jgi:aconitate hydratase
VAGGVGKIFEYYGPGLDQLSAMDRHVIANMGAELGATTTVFPSDGKVKEFLKRQGRESDWTGLAADADAEYDEYEEIDLSGLEPLIALPSSPGNVVPVRDVEGQEIYQSYIGSSANPGLRDFAVAALIVGNRQIHERVSLDINPTSRQILENMIALGLLEKLIHSGARLHQAGCNGCIGMGQAPATGRISLRTVPRNFPGRSGTKDDLVYLCSPETAAASALKGVITDPRTLDMEYPRFEEPATIRINTEMLIPPSPPDKTLQLEKGPNIKPLPDFNPLPEKIGGPVLLKVGDNISTDEIMPAGAKVLPYRKHSDISKFVFAGLMNPIISVPGQQRLIRVVAGANYGQGSSREHAPLRRAIWPAHCDRQPFARIHHQNWSILINL